MQTDNKVLPKDLAIAASSVTKRYRLYKQPIDILIGALTRRVRHEDFYAVNNVSFSARRGEIVGIIGRNGAGKSTLLKMIAGNLEPTSGAITVNGTVAAILELGTGFHPDYTGRENVYIGGMCLGLTRAQVNEKLEDIIEFSELGPYIDRPFKTYSSGMQSRLTFATATSVNPDILIVDEALSVGDARFQRRSFARMEGYRNAGKTILLVSHDTNTVAEFCDRAILLEKGEIVADSDDAKAVVRQYHEMLFGGAQTNPPKKPNTATNGHVVSEPVSANQDNSPHLDIGAFQALASHERLSTHYGNAGEQLDKPGVGDGRVRIIDAAIIDAAGAPIRTLEASKSYSLWMRIQAIKACDEIVPGFLIKSKKGVDLYGFDSNWARMQGVGPMEAGQTCDVRLLFQNHLANGDYFVTFALADAEAQKHDVRFDLIDFKSSGSEKSYTTSVVNLYGEYDWALLEQ